MGHVRDALKKGLVAQWGKELAQVMVSEDEKRIEPLMMSIGFWNEDK